MWQCLKSPKEFCRNYNLDLFAKRLTVGAETTSIPESSLLANSCFLHPHTCSVLFILPPSCWLVKLLLYSRVWRGKPTNAWGAG